MTRMAAPPSAPPNRSLSLRLFGCFAAVMVLLWIIMLAGMLLEAAGVNRDRQERELGVFARMSLHALADHAGGPGLAERARRFMALEDEMRNVYYADCIGPVTMQVWRGATLVYDHGGLPGARPAGGLARLEHGGTSWLTASATDPRSGLTVRVGTEETLGFLLRKTNWSFMFLPHVLSMPLNLIPLWFVVRRGLRPIREIIGELRGRDSADLSPLATPPYRELQPLTGAINTLMERLDERISRERDLLADAAHELKTPMAIIQANADNLLAARGAAQQARAHAGLEQGVRRGAHAVHQLLAYARSGAHAADLRQVPLDLGELLLDRVACFATVGLARGIDMELDCQPGVTLPLHRESMAAVIDNILDNAMKYAPDGSRVRVTLAANAEGTTLEVSDQGPGIAPELRAKVFERFYRIPGSTASGSGLGLPIARRALLHNGGTIALNDAHGGGLRVVIALPPPSAPPTAALSAAPELLPEPAPRAVPAMPEPSPHTACG
ncbi:HAMP domain-containing histidine kinase [Massilia arenosa]|uniref:histidine kinase n=1 Tax=Zemynaea arenosa TaxID=2561931 RepID=A0A4Y9S2P6_9BURK|nr:HAMP domain-containing sensor histidine kinase [Massilia arenosa]TFW15632.1 HAMP domain-containing histidine kinase [Massilia arenosa]